MSAIFHTYIFSPQIEPLRIKVAHKRWEVSSTPFPFYFLVNLNFNLVSSLLALFVTTYNGNLN